jgi:hypothetical protein
MLKHLTQTGIGIRFDQALCTDVHLASELETHIISHRHPKTQLKQKERKIKVLPLEVPYEVFLFFF